MAISRTAWIDDDGSGQTGTVINNAEKTLLYNQIDAALAPLSAPVTGSWTPVDASGAALALTAVGRYVRIGNLVMVQANITYPGTANGGPAMLGGLPFPCHASIWGGLYQTYGVLGVAIDLNGTTIGSTIRPPARRGRMRI